MAKVKSMTLAVVCISFRDAILPFSSDLRNGANGRRTAASSGKVWMRRTFRTRPTSGWILGRKWSGWRWTVSRAKFLFARESHSRNHSLTHSFTHTHSLTHTHTHTHIPSHMHTHTHTSHLTRTYLLTLGSLTADPS